MSTTADPFSTPDLYRSVITMFFEDASSSFRHDETDYVRTITFSCSTISRYNYDNITKQYSMEQVPQEEIKVKLDLKEVSEVVSIKWANYVIEEFKKSIEKLRIEGQDFLCISEGNVLGWLPEDKVLEPFIEKMLQDLISDAKIIIRQDMCKYTYLEYDLSNFPANEVPDKSFDIIKKDEVKCENETSTMSLLLSSVASVDLDKEHDYLHNLNSEDFNSSNFEM